MLTMTIKITKQEFGDSANIGNQYQNHKAGFGGFSEHIANQYQNHKVANIDNQYQNHEVGIEGIRKSKTTLPLWAGYLSERTTKR
jgi:hypothetical protein